MSSHIARLEARARELKRTLAELTEFEKHGVDVSRRRLRYASKLRHVEDAILVLKQRRLF